MISAPRCHVYFTIGVTRLPARGCFSSRIKVEEAHAQHAAAVTDLAHHHAAGAQSNLGMQDIAFNSCPNARNRSLMAYLGTIFITQGR